jgi:hypothetical protein
MSITELLDTLLATIEQAETDRRRGNDVVMELLMPAPGDLLDERGQPLGLDEETGRRKYGFTLTQVRAMSDTLRAAIREEAGLPAPDRRTP